LDKSENVKAFSKLQKSPLHSAMGLQFKNEGWNGAISEFDFSPPKFTFQTIGEPRAQGTRSVSIMNEKAFGRKELTSR
jgi:hypothetical protein